MKLSDISRVLDAAGLTRATGPFREDIEITDVCTATGQAVPGSLFCCVRGFRADGHFFAAEAESKGAVAFLAEHPVPTSRPVLIAENIRKASAAAAAAVHGHPAKKLRLAAVTGTNGKSTTAWLTRSILRQGGMPCGLLGTILYDDGTNPEPGDRTTPDGPSVQRWLGRMAANGQKACVMEASSHGLDLQRLEGCRFEALAFTNLTPEHLDFHGDMEGYFRAKLKLFADYATPAATFAVNADDPWGRRLAGLFPQKTMTYGIGAEAESRARILAEDLDGTTLDLFLPGLSALLGVRSPLVGLHNVSNVLAASTLAVGLGIGPDAVREGIERVPPVPGRLQRFPFDNGICCFIDYAHTPDGLEKALEAVGKGCRGVVHAVFGLGGERTTENRPIMGRVAAMHAEHVVITMDNPRSEEPMSIARQIESGLQGARLRSHSVILDRKEAVHAALDAARPGDVVLVAGKGPETTMILADGPVPYNDEESVREWGASRGLALVP